MGHLVKELAESDFATDVLQNPLPSLVDFWGDGCPPCVLIAPILEELAGEYAGKINIYKAKAVDLADVAVEYGITAVPTLLLFKNGSLVNRLVGALPKAHLAKFIEPVLG